MEIHLTVLQAGPGFRMPRRACNQALGAQKHPQGVLVRGHAGLVINKLSQGAARTMRLPDVQVLPLTQRREALEKQREDGVYVYVVPWSEFPIVPSYPHCPQAPPRATIGPYA